MICWSIGCSPLGVSMPVIPMRLYCSQKARMVRYALFQHNSHPNQLYSTSSEL